jgi:hypothetical protein
MDGPKAARLGTQAVHSDQSRVLLDQLQRASPGAAHATGRSSRLAIRSVHSQYTK